MKAVLALPPRPHILVVDDHHLVRRACEALLTPIAEVVLVGDSRAAVAALSERVRFDLVLLDLSLPGIVGFWALDELLEGDASLADRIVVFSGCTHSREQRLLEALGVRWLCKPVGAGVLRALVASLPLPAMASGASQADAPL